MDNLVNKFKYLGFSLCFLLIFSCKLKEKNLDYEFLKAVSNTTNKNCPVQVDSIIRLENTVAHPVATFQYNYVLKFDTVKYDIREFEKSLKITTLNTIKTSPDAKMFRDMEATLRYNYSDTLGNHLFVMVFEPKDYKL